MICVLDASVTLAWILRENPKKSIDSQLDLVAEHGAVVPSVWRLEVANGLLVAMRRKRIDQGLRDATLLSLTRLPIEVDEETDSRAWTETLRLSDLYGLTIYDASYLELALRKRLPLATLDQELMKAARGAGAEFLPII